MDATCWRNRFGVFDRDLIESALARPKQAAVYESANLIRQAATLCFGLIKNHPWAGGNKRTATALVQVFLKRNGYKLAAKVDETVDMALAVEADIYKVDDIESWLLEHVIELET